MKTILVIIALAAGCSSSRADHVQSSTSPVQPEPVPEATASEGATELTPFEAGEALFEEQELRGTFIVQPVDSPALVAFPDLVDVPYVPASTFKIPNSLIGLETGVITDVSFSLPWDGVERPIEIWNQDHDLTSALAASVVWYYQEVARRVGQQRMVEWVRRLEYGNREIGASVDTFWLEGPLVITAREQVQFLEALTAGRLPVSERSVSILRGIMPSRQVGQTMLYAKTGTALEAPGCHAWLVGWMERDGDITAHFALLLLCDADQIPSRTMRWELVERLLEAAEGTGGQSS